MCCCLVCVCEGGVFAGVISDITGGRAVTCIVMMVIALPMVCHSLELSLRGFINDGKHHHHHH